MTEEQTSFALAVLLKPFILLIFLWLVACLRIVFARHFPDCKLKRLLLLPLHNRRG